MSSLQRFLSIPDVAEVLHVSVRQVRSLLSSGELRGIQVGGRGVWRIEKSELERYIAHQYELSAQAESIFDATDSTEPDPVSQSSRRSQPSDREA